jgi:hypothetical protein
MTRLYLYAYILPSLSPCIGNSNWIMDHLMLVYYEIVQQNKLLGTRDF